MLKFQQLCKETVLRFNVLWLEFQKQQGSFPSRTALLKYNAIHPDVLLDTK